MRITRTRVAALAATTAVVLAALAGSAQPTSAAPAAKQANIVQTAVAAGQFKTLAKLLKAAGLAGTLQGKGPFTVFAPTDAAFAKVPKSTLNALAKDKAKLRAVLLYHVVKGRYASTRVAKSRTLRTLNGQSVRVRLMGSSVYVGAARVTKADVKATNGVIHVLNTVLIPS
jgi:uncharacterized surface protein with fasciclin (FAS1) repeats